MIKFPGKAEEWEMCGTSRQPSPAVPKASGHPHLGRGKPAGAGAGAGSSQEERGGLKTAIPSHQLLNSLIFNYVHILG